MRSGYGGKWWWYVLLKGLAMANTSTVSLFADSSVVNISCQQWNDKYGIYHWNLWRNWTRCCYFFILLILPIWLFIKWSGMSSFWKTTSQFWHFLLKSPKYGMMLMPEVTDDIIHSHTSERLPGSHDNKSSSKSTEEIRIKQNITT